MTAPPAHDAEFFELQRALAGEYSLERELGRGGMGVVYLAREVQLERLVAIKVLNPALAASPDARERFVREARTAANLSHPNIVPIHRVGEAHGFVYFVMTFIDGETLGARIRGRGPLTANVAAKLLRETAWALGHAHDHDVVHRDVKPDNILIERDSGRALVTDFGIAQVGPRGVQFAEPFPEPFPEPHPEPHPEPSKIMGTAHWMSPEQGRGAPVDARSDLYSLGVVGHYALTGRVPFDGATASAIIAKHAHAPRPVLIETPGVPRMLAEAMDRCLRRDPASRFSSARELADALEADAMARLEFPAPVRAWLQTQNPLRLILIVWVIFGSMGIIGSVLSTARGVLWLEEVMKGMAITFVPLVTLFGFHLSQTRRALQAGYSLSDLRQALVRWVDAKREDLTFAAAAVPRWMKIVRIGTWSLIGGFLGGALLLATLGGVPNLQAWLDALGYLGMAAGGSLLVSNALGIPLVGKPRTKMVDGQLRIWFWGSRLGVWLGRYLARGRTAPMHVMNRPTEAALSVAALELFEGLPRAYRKDLHDLPDVVKRLEARAVDMRRHVEDLSALLARAERDASLEEVTRERTVRKQLVESREKAKSELGTTVAALETIRLGLLKLNGGVDVANTITELIERAQSAADDLDRLAAAAKELDLAFPDVSTNA